VPEVRRQKRRGSGLRAQGGERFRAGAAAVVVGDRVEDGGVDYVMAVVGADVVTLDLYLITSRRVGMSVMCSGDGIWSMIKFSLSDTLGLSSNRSLTNTHGLFRRTAVVLSIHPTFPPLER